MKLRFRAVLWSAALSLPLSWLTHGLSEAQPSTMPVNFLHSARLGTPAGGTTTPLSAANVLPMSTGVGVRPNVNVAPRIRMHPKLGGWIQARPASDRERLVVTYRDSVPIFRFPHADPRRPRLESALARSTARDLAQRTRVLRRPFHDRIGHDLSQNFNARVIEEFWVTQSVLVDMPLGRVQHLLDRRPVVYIGPEVSGEPPPQQPPEDENPDDNVEAARKHINSDPYFDPQLDYGFMGLLDTGIDTTHVLIGDDPDRELRDCVDGDALCMPQPGVTYVTSDVHPSGHGTASAAIVIGNDAFGDRCRGVTRLTLDSFRVYEPGAAEAQLAPAAVQRAVQRILAEDLDDVLLMEIDNSGGPWSDVSLAAQAAYAANRVVIAAAGNRKAGTVGAPGNGHNVIAVGTFDVIEPTITYLDQSSGPTEDGRIKPDIQAPTSTETAKWGIGEKSAIALTGYGGTSGAAPYAAGVAALWRNWLSERLESNDIDAGQVYVMMILSGSSVHPFNDREGADNLRMPDRGWGSFGRVELTAGDSISIPITFGDAGVIALHAALWWESDPYDPNGDRSNINLRIELDADESGEIHALHSTSDDASSVFERAVILDVDSAAVVKEYRIVITAPYVPYEKQRVWYAAALLSDDPDGPLE